MLICIPPWHLSFASFMMSRLSSWLACLFILHCTCEMLWYLSIHGVQSVCFCIPVLFAVACSTVLPGFDLHLIISLGVQIIQFLIPFTHLRSASCNNMKCVKDDKLLKAKVIIVPKWRTYLSTCQIWIKAKLVYHIWFFWILSISPCI